MPHQFERLFNKYIKKKKIYVIAEAGVNHNGKMSVARKLILEAKKVGADAIKFQLFSAEDVVTKKAKKTDYQIKNTKNSDSQYSMIKKLELKKKDFIKLKKIAASNNIDFVSSIFDANSLSFLSSNLKLPIIKIPSGEITNYPLLNELNYKKKYIFLSTGMSNLKEIVEAINCICKKSVFSISNQKIKIINKKIHNEIKKRIFIFHCVTDYPVEDNFANLNCIETLRKKLDLLIGYSDHTLGTNASLIAVAKGAIIIEKHFTLNNNMNGPDHLASLNPKSFKKLTQKIRQYESLIGNGVKKIQKCEIKNSRLVRKSIVAKTIIKKGDLFNFDNITTKRPGTGLSPFFIKKLLNKKATKNYLKDELIKIYN